MLESGPIHPTRVRRLAIALRRARVKILILPYGSFRSQLSLKPRNFEKLDWAPRTKITSRYSSLLRVPHGSPTLAAGRNTSYKAGAARGPPGGHIAPSWWIDSSTPIALPCARHLGTFSQIQRSDCSKPRLMRTFRLVRSMVLKI